MCRCRAWWSRATATLFPQGTSPCWRHPTRCRMPPAKRQRPRKNGAGLIGRPCCRSSRYSSGRLDGLRGSQAGMDAHRLPQPARGAQPGRPAAPARRARNGSRRRNPGSSTARRTGTARRTRPCPRRAPKRGRRALRRRRCRWLRRHPPGSPNAFTTLPATGAPNWPRASPRPGPAGCARAACLRRASTAAASCRCRSACAASARARASSWRREMSSCGQRGAQGLRLAGLVRGTLGGGGGGILRLLAAGLRVGDLAVQRSGLNGLRRLRRLQMPALVRHRPPSGAPPPPAPPAPPRHRPPTGAPMPFSTSSPVSDDSGPPGTASSVSRRVERQPFDQRQQGPQFGRPAPATGSPPPPGRRAMSPMVVPRRLWPVPVCGATRRSSRDPAPGAFASASARACRVAAAPRRRQFGCTLLLQRAEFGWRRVRRAHQQQRQR